MSFRKRSEVLNSGSGVQANASRGSPVGNMRNSLGNMRNPVTNSRTPGAILSRNVRGTPVSRDAQSTPVRGLGNLSLNDNVRASQDNNLVVKSNLLDNHPGVRPSPATSHPTTSTGCADLDKLMLHSGLPLGNSLLIEEKGSTEFNSILCKLIIAQGIVHNRTEPNKNNTHIILITVNQGLAREIPGIYHGSRRDIKKSKISEEESKVTVQNIAEKSSNQRSRDLKIAWRYGLNDKKKDDDEGVAATGDYKNYNHQFDITTRIMPAPTAGELSIISPMQPIKSLLTQVEEIIKRHANKLIRIVIPSMLHPAMYPPDMFKLQVILPLLHGLKSLIKLYEQRCVLFTCLSTDILDSVLVSQIENVYDAVMVLEPFGQEMLQFLERAYKSQPNKVQHGLIHIYKRPIFSDLGEMHLVKSEWAFKNGRKKFEIEEWGIPVEDEEDDGSKKDKTDDVLNTSDLTSGTSHNHDYADHNDHDHKPSSNTTIDIDF